MRTAGKAAAVAGVGAVVTLTRRMTSHRHDASRGSGGDREDHRLAVTVNCSPDQVGSGESLPEPLARLRDGIEVTVRPAAGDKGTELHARPIGDDVSREDLRIALRQAKSLIETGMVLRPDTPPSTHPGPAGKILQSLIRKSRGEGRL